MAKTFYTAEEAAAKLGATEDEIKKLARDGKIREFRDAGNINFKADEIDRIAAERGAPTADASESTGEIVLEPVDESSIELAPSESDVLSLDEADPSDKTSSGTAINKAQKEGSVVPSVGVNVFDDDELDEVVDPLAQTAVTDVGGLGIDGIGSGSGIMELSRESDDTSLGAELLDEIYSGDEEGGTVEMGEATRAGLEEAIVEPDEEAPTSEQEQDVFQPEAGFEEEAAVAPAAAAEVVRVVEYGPDAMSTGLTAAMVVAVVVMWVGGLAGASLVRGVTPGIVEFLYENLMIFAGGSLLVALLALGGAFFVSRKKS